MKKVPALTIILAFLLFVSMAMPEIQLADCYSETQTLWAHGVGGFPVCELHAGDRLEMSFSLANMGQYVAMVPEMNIIATREAYYSVNLTFGLGLEKIVTFDNSRGDSFSYTALKSGLFSIGYRCEGGYGFVDAKDPVMTINYDIIKAETPAPSNPAPRPSSTIQPSPSSVMQPQVFSAVYTAVILALLILAIAIIAITIVITKKHITPSRVLARCYKIDKPI